jgi:exonuclease SbcC
MVRLELVTGAEASVPLADQVQSVKAEVTRILGLNADAFTQAVVLPQGEFARFLKSKPADRNRLLNGLFRLDLYERMRVRAADEARRRETSLQQVTDLLEREYAGVTAEALEELCRHGAETRRRIADLERCEAQAASRLRDAEELLEGTRQLAELEVEIARLRAQQHVVEEKRRQIEIARRAARVLPSIARLRDARAQAATAERDLKVAEEACAARAAELTAAEVRQQVATEAAAAVPALRERQQVVVGLIQRAAELRDLVARLAEARGGLEGSCNARTSSQGALDRLDAEEQAAAGLLADARQRFIEVAFDEDLWACLESARDEATALSALYSDLEMSGQRLKQAAAELEKARVAEQQANELVVEAAGREATEKQRCEEARTYYERAVRDDHITHLRARLSAGQQCPVCEQPVAVVPPAPAAAALEALRERRDAAERAFEQARNAASEARQQAATAAAGTSHAEANLALRQQEAAGLASAVATADRLLRERLGTHLSDSLDNGAVAAWVIERLDAVRGQRDLHLAAERQIVAAELQLDKARTAAAGERVRLAALEQTITAQEQAVAGLESQVRPLLELFDKTCPDGEPLEVNRDLLARISILEHEQDAAREALSAARTAAAAAAAAAETRRKVLAERCDAREQASQQLAKELDEAGFPTSAECEAASLNESEVAELEAAIGAYERETQSLEERIDAARAALGERRGSVEDVEGLRKLATEARALLAAAQIEAGRVGEAERSMAERLGAADEYRKRGETLAVEHATYQQLAQDLRSDRFQEFLLDEVFRELMAGATKRLADLSGDRYGLEKSDTGLDVVDRDNGSERRSVDTLSGGETFLASLALALELSEQVQRAAGAVRLDSLFIDEGFGTLDAETLQTVSEAVHSLAAGGRMIGVITHLPELRDEFEQKVLVSRVRGRSVIEVVGGEAASWARNS